MRYPALGRFTEVEAFRRHLAGVAPGIELVDATTGRDGPLGQAREVPGLRVGNRFAIHPMEGWDGSEDGLPSEHTLRRWRRFGQSGAKLIWGGEAFAVQADGRANPRQLYLNPAADVAGGLEALRRSLLEGHAEIGQTAEGLVIGLQLTHSGRFSRPNGPALEPKLAAPHPVLAEKYGLTDETLLSDAELEGIAANYVRAAVLAREVGFDFVDVKACHGYLMHELLGARHRPGPYGGDFEGRTRLFRRVVEGVRREAPGLAIGVRVSLADLVPFRAGPNGVGEAMPAPIPFESGFGVDPADPRRFDLDEPLRFLALLQELDIALVNVSLGSPYYCPHLQRPASTPPSDGYQPPEDPLCSVARHLEVVRAAKRAFPGMAFVGTGYTYLQQFLPHVAEREVGQGRVDFVGLGRMVLSYPQLPRDVLEGRSLQRRLICRTFSDCTTAPRHHLISGCYPLDAYYKELPEAQQVREIKRSLRG